MEGHSSSRSHPPLQHRNATERAQTSSRTCRSNSRESLSKMCGFSADSQLTLRKVLPTLLQLSCLLFVSSAPAAATSRLSVWSSQRRAALPKARSWSSSDTTCPHAIHTSLLLNKPASNTGSRLAHSLPTPQQDSLRRLA